MEGWNSSPTEIFNVDELSVTFESIIIQFALILSDSLADLRDGLSLTFFDLFDLRSIFGFDVSFFSTLFSSGDLGLSVVTEVSIFDFRTFLSSSLRKDNDRDFGVLFLAVPEGSDFLLNFFSLVGITLEVRDDARTRFGSLTWGLRGFGRFGEELAKFRTT